MGNIDDTKIIFSKNLKHYMQLYNLSQTDISQITGVSQQSVSNWLNCKLMPRMGVIEKLANYFKIKKSDLLEDRSEKNNKANIILKFNTLLKEKGYTIDRLSNETEIPKKLIEMYANGDIQFLNDDDLKKISNTLGINYWELLDWERLLYNYMDADERRNTFSQFLTEFEIFVTRNDYDTAVTFINIAIKCLELDNEKLTQILKIIDTF